jgi:hypothetical protein
MMCYLVSARQPHRSSSPSPPAERQQRFLGEEDVILSSSEDFTFHLIGDALMTFPEYAMPSGFSDRRLTSPTQFEGWPSVEMYGGFLADTYPLIFAPAVDHRFLLLSMNDCSAVTRQHSLV